VKINVKALSIDERIEWQQLLSDALNGDRQATEMAVSRALHMMDQAERAGRQWPEEVRRQAVRASLKDSLKAQAKSEDSVLVDYHGRLVAKDRRRGVRTLVEGGKRVFQQRLIDEMTWDEFETWASMNNEQIEGLLVNREVANALAALHVKYPETETVSEALALDGISLDDLLAGAA